MSFQEVGDRIFRRRYTRLDQNIGVILGDETACVIDSRSNHADADELRSELRHLTSLPVRFLVNTHMHWDHTFGNSRFPEATIVGHRDCRRRLLEDGDEMKATLLSADWVPADQRAAFGDVVVTPPKVTFSSAVELYLEDRPLTLRHYGRGHTDNDIAVFVDDVCFAGDLVEEGAPPSFGDSYPDDWVTTLGALIADLSGTVVPGHGDVVDPDFVRDQRDQIAAAV
ncbi:MAG: MBL fold metallo-hydrolase, partial [Acidimicrobiia bacterium]|nr:MBL fold metallo-hydrolase [Acidimicrobiia bacterium]